MPGRGASAPWWAAALLLAIGCGGHSSPAASSPWALRASLGAYDDGSGRQGIAALLTLRDASGAGPAAGWTVTLTHESGASFTLAYDAPGPGSHSAEWRMESAPLAGTWSLEASNGPESIRSSFTLGSGAGLPAPAPSLSADGATIQWPGVPGAAAYLCRVHSGGVLQLEAQVSTPACDVSGLPDGAYAASVVALSYGVAQLQGDPAREPVLPARFDVSEGRLGFARGGGAATATLKAVGGAYDNGVGPRSLAVWLAIANADGTPLASDWSVEIVGPNLPASNPLVIGYGKGFPRLMAWAVGIPASVGTYTATATSGASVATTQFTVGSPSWLPMPTGVVATGGALGAATVTWAPVAGAGSYLASAYDSVTGALVASQWASTTSTTFAEATFTAGRSYDVFVAASDADMVGGLVPTQVSIAENVFDYSTFTAR